MHTLTRIPRRSVLAAALGAGLLQGCANTAVPAPRPGDGRLHTHLSFVDPELQPIPPETLRRPFEQRPRMRHVRAPDPIELLFLGVPGRIAGPAPHVLLRRRLRALPSALEAQSQSGFAVELDPLRDGLERLATPWQQRPEDRGMRVEPAPARLARLALAPAVPGQVQPYPALCGFLERASGQEHLLLFTDRACRITGQLDLERSGTFTDAHPAMQRRFTGLFEHSLDLPGAGLHWLRIEPAGERRWRVNPAGAPRAPEVFILESGARLG